MPSGPSDGADPCEIATTDDVEQQVVALHETPRPAGFHVYAESPGITVVPYQFDARERNTVP